MPIYSDGTLKKHAAKGLVHPYDPSLVNPASIDLRLGNAWIDLKDAQRTVINATHVMLYNETLKVTLYNYIAYSSIGRALKLEPKLTLVLATTREVLNIPDNSWARVALKTTPCREGLGHPVADWIDPGFHGQLTLMLHAFKPIRLSYNMRICQLIVGDLDWACEVPYVHKGHYQGQHGPTRSWRSVQQSGLKRTT